MVIGVAGSYKLLPLRYFLALMWKNYRCSRKRPVILFCITILPIASPLLLRAVYSRMTVDVCPYIDSWPLEKPDLCFKYDRHNRSTYCVDEKTHLWVYYTPHANVTKDVMSSVQKTGSHLKIGNVFIVPLHVHKPNLMLHTHTHARTHARTHAHTHTHTHILYVRLLQMTVSNHSPYNFKNSQMTPH